MSTGVQIMRCHGDVGMQISQARLEEVQRELGALTDRRQPLQLRYESEKVRSDDLRSLQQKKEDLQIRLQQAENRFDLAMVADIRYLQSTALCLPRGNVAGYVMACKQELCISLQIQIYLPCWLRSSNCICKRCSERFVTV